MKADLVKANTSVRDGVREAPADKSAEVLIGCLGELRRDQMGVRDCKRPIG